MIMKYLMQTLLTFFFLNLLVIFFFSSVLFQDFNVFEGIHEKFVGIYEKKMVDYFVLLTTIC